MAESDSTRGPEVRETERPPVVEEVVPEQVAGVAPGATVVPGSKGRKPVGLEWRASYWFTTLVVGSGLAVDFVVYSIIIPVVPFQLETLGYTGVSSLAGWLLFAYSGGLLLFTFPVAMLSERYSARKWPLIIGFVVLIASQIMFMEAPNYAVMCVARFVQGVSSAIVNIVGLALLCDATPEHLAGQQLGLAMIGFSVGLIIGPPIGGVLYSKFGFRGPFIFGVIFATVDLIGRFVIVERKDALKWNYDPHTSSFTGKDSRPGLEDKNESAQEKVGAAENEPAAEKKNKVAPGESGPRPVEEGLEQATTPKPKPLSFVSVMGKMVRSPRAVASGVITFLYGVIYVSQEPSIPLHLQAVWNLSSDRVGVIFIACVIPTLFSVPLSGWLSDKKGTAGVTVVFLVLSIPWFAVMIIEGRLALFITSFALSSFFASGVISPVTAELAAVSRSIEGVGCKYHAHVYGVFNAAYGAGSTIGPVIGGQMYDRLEDGWQAIIYLATGLAVLGALIALFLMGELPLAKCVSIMLKSRNRPSPVSPQTEA